MWGYRTGQTSGSDDGRPQTLTRRRALGVLGATIVGGAVGTARGAPADATVEESGSGYRATNDGQEVYSGGDLAAAIQAAIESLSDGRSSKERVLVTASGEVGESVDLPSYTTLDVQGTLTASSGVIPIYADRVESIEIPNYTVEGSPGMGMRLRRSDDVTLGQISIDVDSGIGIRIDDAHNDGNPQRCRNVTIGSVDVTGTGSHAVETYGVDGFSVERVHARDTGGCGLLLNDTADATVGTVVGYRNDPDGGYASFRVANDAGPNISVDHVTSRSSARGIFGVSNSGGVTIDSVHIVGATANGVLVQNCQDFEIAGGLVRNCEGEAVRIDSRDGGSHPPAQNVTISGLRVVDARSDPRQSWAIRETGPGTTSNRIAGNDVRDGGTTGLIETYADDTVVENNTTDGSTNLVESGTYRIEAVHSGKVLAVAGGSTENGANVVQQEWAGTTNQKWDVEHLGGGVYRLDAHHSGNSLDVLERSVEAGASVKQWEPTGGANQRFHVVDRGGGEYSIEAVHSGMALDVFEAATADGADVVQWPWSGTDNQRWTFTPVEKGGPTPDPSKTPEPTETPTPEGPEPIDGNRPTDLDGDGRYEDLNGNGRLDSDDVVTFFEHKDEAAVTDHVSKYDFNGNGRIDYDDIASLFGEL